jgi:hypothetical protein
VFHNRRVSDLPPGVHHRAPRRGSPTLVGLAVTALLLAGVVLVGPGDELQTARRLLGLAPDRYGSPPAYTAGEGSYRFLLTQRGSDEPVGYDPCRPIEYSVNPDGAPADWEDLVETAVSRTEWATGLEFDDLGTTDDRPFNPLQRGSFSGTPRPVVIGFADADEVAGLEGDVAGLGGSLAVRVSLGRDYYVTGSIALDTDVFDEPSSGSERTAMQAVVDHEFGHLVGLDHVDDTGELMYETSLGRSDYGPGDLEGLARLGSIPCR